MGSDFTLVEKLTIVSIYTDTLQNVDNFIESSQKATGKPIFKGVEGNVARRFVISHWSFVLCTND